MNRVFHFLNTNKKDEFGKAECEVKMINPEDEALVK